MKAQISYNEISEYIARKFKVRPTLAYIDERTMEVSYRPAVFLPAMEIGIRVEAVRGNIVCLSYQCGAAATLIISGVMAYLEKHIPQGVEINTSNKRINLFLERIPQLAKALEHIELKDLCFDSEGINAFAAMK
jgi:hypothetical protein